MQLAGKIFAITGAANGIGKELCLELGRKHGSKIWACDIDEEALQTLKTEIKKYGGECATHKLDVTDKNAVTELCQTIVQQDGHIDVWINNAGIALNGKFNELSAKDFDKVFEVNLFAVVNATKSALQVMEAHGSGTIVNVASVAGHVACPYMTPYVASKHAVVGFTRALRTELEINYSPIRIVMVSPGFVDTRILNKGEIMGFPEWLSWMTSSPEAVAKAIVRGIRQGRAEISPTLNGKMMMGMHKILPNWTVKSSKVLLTKSLKDLLLNRYDV